MATKGQMTGMLGVYLVAAELSKQGFIVSPTSRSAAGADLLVTDQACKKAWSVQVKTNSGRANFWLMGAHASRMKSESHMYVFVNNARGETPEFLAALSEHVADKVEHQGPKGSEWYYFSVSNRPLAGPGWEQFGNPLGDPEIAEALQLAPEKDGQGEPSLE
ncbi:MAG: hypothetical protein ABSF53_17485 [Terracidiphilus sp.]|jgi:hypothetical protein